MRRLRAVVETKCPAAGFAAEGEEVELMAVFVLAVAADGVDVGLCRGGG